MSREHKEAKSVGLDMEQPDKSTSVTTEKELELEGEQPIPLHRHGLETVVFHPAEPTERERSLMMDSCVLFRGRRGLPAAAAAADTWRHKKVKKEKSGSGPEKPRVEEQEQYLFLSPMAGDPRPFLLIQLAPC